MEQESGFPGGLLIYLVGDTRAHQILEAEGFDDFDVVIADAMSANGHLQVGSRRAAAKRKTPRKNNRLFL